MKCKNYNVVVRTLDDQPLIECKGRLDSYSHWNELAPSFEIYLDGQEYPSDKVLWMEATNGNVVVQAKVTVAYVSNICNDPYTKIKSVDGSVKTYDKRIDKSIPCGPTCIYGHPRTPVTE